MAKAHKLLAAGTATLIAEPALAFAHQGGLGIIVGLAVGAVVWGVADDIEQRADGQRPLSASRARQNRRAARDGKLNPAYRLLVGKSQREADPAADEEEGEEETVYIGEEDKHLASRDLLELGPNLHPHVNWFFSKRVSILGMSGSGKSNLLARLVECLGKYDAPLILFDSKPEYRKLCSQRFLVNAFAVSRQNLTPHNARAAATQIMQRRLQVVVDLASYEPEEAAQVMIELALGIAGYQRACLEDGGLLIPCTFIVEEAHEWFPEDESQSKIRGVRLPGDQQTLLAKLQRVYFNLETKGRSFGMGLITSTQRPANLDKRIISEAEWRFMLKAMEPTDLKRYRTYGATDEQIVSLDPNQGEAYVVGPDGSRGVYRIYRRDSPDEAKSPGVENLRRAAAVGGVPRVPAFPDQGRVERGNTPAGTFPTDVGTPWKQPAEPLPPVSASWERSPQCSPDSGNTGNASQPTQQEAEVGYTPREEQAVLHAYHELLAANGGIEPTRRDIQRHLGGGGRLYQRLIRPVLDKHGIAMKEVEENRYGNN